MSFSASHAGNAAPKLIVGVLGLAVLGYVGVLYLSGEWGPKPILEETGTATVEQIKAAPVVTIEPQLPAPQPIAPASQTALPTPVPNASPLFPMPGPALVTVAPAPGPVSTVPQPAQNLSKLRDLQQQMQDIMAHQAEGVDIKKLDSVLAQLEAMQSQSGGMGGVDFGVIRRNLSRANQMQQLGLEIQQLAENSSSADSTQMDGAMQKIQALQAEMEAVTVPPEAPAPPDSRQ